jgi:signal transduction histidine kinase
MFIHKVSQRLTKPISQLHRQMDDIIDKGGIESEVCVASQDEVGRLAAVFNNMMRELRLRHESLAESQEKYRQLYEKLQELYRLKSIFVADASHHLRTPLTIIGGEIEVTLRQERQAAEYEEVLKIVADETKHLGKIVDNLLTLGKAEAGNLVFLQEEVDLTEICERQLKQACLLAKNKGLRLDHEIEKDCFLSGDPNRLAEMIFNLIENATKYTPEGTSIRVTLEGANDEIRLEVADTGIGIAPEELDKIFDRFYRGKNSPTKTKGAGLGLAICQSIAKAHGGAIEVSSQVGKGSTFQVTLPGEIVQIPTAHGS